jgi:hypothetical protein
MTIENALSGLSYSMFCALTSLLIIGLSIITGTAMIYGFIKALNYLLRAMKGGVNSLKESAKALTYSTISGR